MSPVMSSQSKTDDLRVSGGLGRVFRAVRHVRQNRERVQCELLVERLQLRVPSPKKVSFEWIRGPKRVSSSETHTLHKNVWTCQWSTPLVLIATLFWTMTAEGEKRYASKETCIRFLDMSISRQKESRLGEVVFDLAEAAQSKQSTLRATVPLAKSLDPNARVSLKLTVMPISQDDGGGDGDDSSSSELGSHRRTPSSPPPQLAASTKALLRRRSMRTVGAAAILDVKSLSQARGDASPVYSDAEELTNRSRHGDLTGRQETARDHYEISPARRSRMMSREISLISVTAGDGRNASTYATHTRELTPRSPTARRELSPTDRAYERPVASATFTPLKNGSYRQPDFGALVRNESSSKLSSGTPADSTTEGNKDRPQIADLRKQLERKDQQIATLMEHLTAMHGALEASGKLNALDRQAFESMVNKAGLNLASFKPMSSQSHEAGAIEKKLNADLKAEKSRASDLQRLLSQQQEDLDDARKAKETELLSARDEVQKLSERCRRLEQALQQQKSETQAMRSASSSALKPAESLDTQRRMNLERELEGCHFRIKDLEKQLKDEREKASAERLRASETISRLKEKLEVPVHSPGSPLSSLTKGELINKIRRMEAVEQSGDRNRIVDLEEELVNVKVRLAQLETEKEEVIEKARKRIETLKSSCREYALTVDALEREVATLKLSMKRSTSLLRGPSHVMNL